MGARTHSQKPAKKKRRAGCPGPEAWAKMQTAARVPPLQNAGTASPEFRVMPNARVGDAENPYLQGRSMLSPAISGAENAADLIDSCFLAYNGARLREACRLFVEKMLDDKATVGLTLSGAMTPAGLGCSCLVPLIEAGFVDWIVSTGANMYHDLHFAFNLPLRVGSPAIPDVELREHRIVRIYDVFLHYDDVLLATDAILRDILKQDEFQKEMGTAEMYHRIGRYADEYERKASIPGASVLAAAYRAGVPIFTSAPGDSTIGMNIAGLAMRGNRLKIDPSVCVNQSAAIVLGAKRAYGGTGTHGSLMLGGGSPKNFMLQTEPQIQEILGIPEAGQDYFLQITDARPDTGGLSGATPGEAVTWGKVDPNKLPDMVVCYVDSAVALPLLTSYALARRKKRPLKRLFERLDQLGAELQREFERNKNK
ncbi:MAG TPA: deoxyhypusine synthase [Planctomycetota bacterium]|nr:deoxyhypusine synthase [Planctomycetota bacterium]